MKNYELLNMNLQLFAEDDEEDNNPFSNFEDFVASDEEEDSSEPADEQDEYIEEEEEELPFEEEEEPKKEQKKQPKRPEATADEGKKQLSKQEYALVQEKRKNKDLVGMMKTLMEEVASLKNSENERTIEKKKTQYVQSYLEDGYDELSATRMAEKDLKIDSINSEIGNLRKMVEEVQKGTISTYETKTQAEQAMLYKQAKAKQSKVDTIANTSGSEGVKLTPEQKRDWEAYKKAPWGQGKSLKEFLKLHKETFG